MKRCFAVAAACGLAVLLAGPFAPPARAASPPTLVTLKNGLRVVLAPDSFATSVDVATWYAVGVSSTTAELTGARHVLERQLFMGTPDGAWARALLAEGGFAGAATTADAIVTWETMPAEALGLALRTEAKRMGLAAPLPATWNAFREAAVADVRSRTLRLPLAGPLARLSAQVYRGEPYARPVLASEDALRKLAPESAIAWQKGRLAPGNAVLTIVGRFDPAPTLELVHRTFDPLPRGTAAAAVAAAAPAPSPRRAIESGPTPSPMLLVGWRVPGIADPDAAAIEFLAGVVGGSDDSRLNRALTVDFPVATGAQCGLDRRRDASMLWAVAAARTDVDSTDVEHQLVDNVGGLARDPLPEPELDRARARFLAGAAFVAQDPHVRAEALANAALAGLDPAVVDQRLAAVRQMTPAELQRVAQRVLVENARATVWLLPSGGAR